MIPTTSEYTQRRGIITESAMTRGRTRYSIGFKPSVMSASISSVTRIVPSCAANAAPVRPAMMTPVMIAPISRAMPICTRFATYSVAPNCWSWTAPTNARMRPTRKLISVTIGSASAPVCWTKSQRSASGTRARSRSTLKTATVTSPTNARNSPAPRATSTAASPSRASHGPRRPTVRAPSFSWTVSASSMSRRMPAGSPAKSASTFRSRRSSRRAARNVRIVESHLSSALASNVTRRSPGSAKSRATSAMVGRAPRTIHVPESSSSIASGRFRTTSTCPDGRPASRPVAARADADIRCPFAKVAGSGRTLDPRDLHVFVLEALLVPLVSRDARHRVAVDAEHDVDRFRIDRLVPHLGARFVFLREVRLAVRVGVVDAAQLEAVAVEVLLHLEELALVHDVAVLAVAREALRVLLVAFGRDVSDAADHVDLALGVEQDEAAAFLGVRLERVLLELVEKVLGQAVHGGSVQQRDGRAEAKSGLPASAPTRLAARASRLNAVVPWPPPRARPRPARRRSASRSRGGRRRARSLPRSRRSRCAVRLRDPGAWTTGAPRSAAATSSRNSRGTRRRRASGARCPPRERRAILRGWRHRASRACAQTRPPRRR